MKNENDKEKIPLAISLETIIDEAIEENKERDFLIKEVMEYLKNWDKKQITKRIVDGLRETYPSRTFYLDRRESYFLLSIWGGNIPYSKRIEIYLVEFPWGDKNRKYIDIEKIKEANKTTSAYYEEQAEKLTKFKPNIEKFLKKKEEFDLIFKEYVRFYEGIPYFAERERFFPEIRRK